LVLSFSSILPFAGSSVVTVCVWFCFVCHIFVCFVMWRVCCSYSICIVGINYGIDNDVMCVELLINWYLSICLWLYYYWYYYFIIIYICDILINTLSFFAGIMCAKQPPVFHKTHTTTQPVQLNINVGQLYCCTLL